MGAVLTGQERPGRREPDRRAHTARWARCPRFKAPAEGDCGAQGCGVSTASSGHVGWSCSGRARLIGENERTEGLSGKVNKITPPPGTGALLRGPSPHGAHSPAGRSGRGRGGTRQGRARRSGPLVGAHGALWPRQAGDGAETGRVGRAGRERQPRGGQAEAPDPEASDHLSWALRSPGPRGAPTSLCAAEARVGHRFARGERFSFTPAALRGGDRPGVGASCSPSGLLTARPSRTPSALLLHLVPVPRRTGADRQG